MPNDIRECRACVLDHCRTCTSDTYCTECYEPILYTLAADHTCTCTPKHKMLDDGTCVFDNTQSACYNKPYVYLHNGTCTDACTAGFYPNTNSVG